MENNFTEKDAIIEAEAMRERLIGVPDLGGECVRACPILTAGRLANPNYVRGVVACLRESCAFYDIDSSDPNFRECQLFNAGNAAQLASERLDDVYKLLERRR